MLHRYSVLSLSFLLQSSGLPSSSFLSALVTAHPSPTDIITALKASYAGRGMYGIEQVMICSAGSHYGYGRGDDGWYVAIVSTSLGLRTDCSDPSPLFWFQGLWLSYAAFHSFLLLRPHLTPPSPCRKYSNDVLWVDEQ